MKKLNTFIFIIACLFIGYACNPDKKTTIDKCKDTLCPPNAYCDKGECYCLPGYEGDDCNIVSREKMLGSYTGYVIEENKSIIESIDSNIMFTVSIGENINEIYIKSTNHKSELRMLAKVNKSHFSLYSDDGTDSESAVYSIEGELKGDSLIFVQKHLYYKTTFRGVKQ